MEIAERLKKIPPYLFAQLDKLRHEEEAKGRKIYNLAVGDPIEPTPKEIVEELSKCASLAENHRYSPYAGILEFRKAVASWYEERFHVKLDPEKEILTLIGSKEGIAHIFLAYVNKGDVALIPDPGYPVYRTSTIMADGEPFALPLYEKYGFLPELSKVPEDVAKRAKILFLGYPNNPTTAVAPFDFLKEAVAFCKKYDILLCYDNAYSEVTFDGYIAPSILEVRGAKEVAVEFNSLSKPYNMTGWRLGYAVGNAQAIEALGIVKNNIDSSVFMAIQKAGILALKQGKKWTEQFNTIHKQKRDLLVQTLQSLGWKIEPPKGTFYLWVKVPKGYTSAEFAAFLLKEAGVLVAPGPGYGVHGEGYVRFSITVTMEDLINACEAIKKACQTKSLILV
jgi:LL-diaminopimelate aminotransferase